MSVKTNQLTELAIDDFTLIGIYSSYESYRLAFFLNELLNWHFERCEFDLDIQFDKICGKFPIFRSKFNEGSIDVYLIDNHITVEAVEKMNGSLFDKDIAKFNTYTLLPEYKNLDYLIKIEDTQGRIFTDDIVKSINKTSFEMIATSIPNEQLKSKGHLIIN